MVNTCWVKDCKNRADGSVKRGFYTIPVVREFEGEQTKALSEERRRTWLANINRKDLPSKYSKVCSDHFIQGKPADLYNRSHPDWAPTLKLCNVAGRFKSKKKNKVEANMKRYKRLQCRKKTREEHDIAETLLDLQRFHDSPLVQDGEESTNDRSEKPMKRLRSTDSLKMVFIKEESEDVRIDNMRIEEDDVKIEEDDVKIENDVIEDDVKIEDDVIEENHFRIEETFSLKQETEEQTAYTVLGVLEHIADGNTSDVDCMWSDEEDESRNADRARSPTIGQDRDEPLPEIEVEIEAEDLEDREDDEHEEDLEPVLGDDPFANITKKSNIQWRRNTHFTPVETTWESPTTDAPEPLTPYSYFKQYVPSEMFELMSTMTNIYAEQSGVRGYKHATASEIEVLVGLHMAMGVLVLPRVRMYWSSSINIGIFRDTMSRDRFFQLCSNLHVVNNLERPPGNTDVFFKVRPIYDSIRKRCLQLQLEEELCIDEQIVPFRGKLSVLQYVKGKPAPWGVKMYFLCGKSGLTYDFLIYQGATTELSEQSKKVLGHGAVVFHLSQRIQAPNHKLFFDNHFTTYNVLEILAENKIHAAGTAKLCRFANPPLKTDKDMSKKTRGNRDEVRSRDGKVILVKWFDSRSVVLASNFVGIGDEDEVQRWDPNKRKFMKVKRPEVVRRYNKGMGGVNKLDQLISLYRTDIKSRKWPLRMITHAFDVAVVNSWLEYCRDNEFKGNPHKTMDLLEFKMNVAEVLVRCGKPQDSKKRWRPSKATYEPSTSTTPDDEAGQKRGERECRPVLEVQRDMMDHMPNYDSKKEATRCKWKGCSGKTHVLCDKCKVHYCFVPQRNCFRDAHRK